MTVTGVTTNKIFKPFFSFFVLVTDYNNGCERFIDCSSL